MVCASCFLFGVHFRLVNSHGTVSVKELDSGRGGGGSEEEASTVSVSWKWCLVASRRRWDRSMTHGSEMR